jgi:hypothetical protein
LLLSVIFESTESKRKANTFILDYISTEKVKIGKSEMAEEIGSENFKEMMFCINESESQLLLVLNFLLNDIYIFLI